ncbi:MAG: hypothetical protein Sv326_1112 [Candidatus Fermentimicrarchaeum limneticum]|uniref:Uncharacterized protein n=1 Tax=Fermentimicrarchaeum limneticum TaxID=2795018 RepID=A0A7D5XQ85_FERL1|nr:MAG: hypothetical protein Sv326_1112 [Candidatus Fermentimicrarchaeum limneticum]
MRKLGVLLALLLLAVAVKADFYDLSLNVTAKVNLNGSLHVTELVKLSMDPSSEDLYTRSFYSTELTIMDWQQITKSQYLRQHILSSYATRNFRVAPEDLTRYSFSELSTAVIKLEYDVDGVVLVNQTGPRTLSYTFNRSALSFQPSPSGQMLPKNNALAIIIPPDSIVTSISPDPTEPAITRDYLDQVRGVSAFAWKGTVPINDFTLVFVREEPIDVEVRSFFENVESGFLNFILSAPGIIITLLVLLTVAYLALSKR